MLSLKSLLNITARQLLGHPLCLPHEWENYSRKAYVEPISVTDGHHQFVLMSADDYKALTEETVIWRSLHGASEYVTQAEHDRRCRPAAERRQPPPPTRSPDMTLLGAAFRKMVENSPTPPDPAPGEDICV